MYFIFCKLSLNFFVFSDLSKYNNLFTQDDVYVDYFTAVEMTSELFFLEVTYRVVVCLYEVILSRKK